jgi:hypothetical protein
MRKILFMLFASMQTVLAIAQADCSSATIICGNTPSFNPSGIGTKLEQLACGGIRAQ